MQDVVLRERPRLPRGVNPKNVYLEAVTEFTEAPEAKVEEHAPAYSNELSR